MARYCNASALLAVFFSLLVSPCMQAQTVPELLYYKFNEGSGTVTTNIAIPGAGNPASPVVGHTLSPKGGQFHGGLSGVTNTSGAHFVDTGWDTKLATGDWTLSFWLDVSKVPGTDPFMYVFGDYTAGDFRCFTNGQAGSGNLMLRGPLNEVRVPGGARTTGPAAVAFVYHANVPEIRAYLDGLLVNTVSQTALNISGTGPFKIAGHAGTQARGSLVTGAVLDEFRFYNRALTPAEISATWNIELFPTGLHALFMAAPLSGNAPLTVKFTDRSFTSDPGGVTAWEWDFDNDNKVDSTQRNPVHTYRAQMVYSVRLTVRDASHPPATLTRPGYINVGPYQLSVRSGGGGVGDLVIDAPPSPVGTTEGYTLISATPPPIVGSGPFLGLVPDGLTMLSFFQPAMIGWPWHFLPQKGSYPDVPYMLPPGSLTSLKGMTFDLTVLYFVGTNLVQSNVDRVTI